MTVQCCQCERIRERGTWDLRRVSRDERVSYTYCPQCAVLFRRILWRWRHTARVVGA